MGQKTLEQRKEELLHKTFMLMFRILVIFGIPAAAGYFLGQTIDQHFDIRPHGTLAVLFCTFCFSWVLMIRMYVKLRNEFKELEKQEKEEMQKRQKEVLEKLNNKEE